MPWTAGGLPVVIDMLFGHVKLGTSPSATAANPVFMNRATFGTTPSLTPRSKYAGSPPSMQTTTTGRDGHRYPGRGRRGDGEGDERPCTRSRDPGRRRRQRPGPGDVRDDRARARRARHPGEQRRHRPWRGRGPRGAATEVRDPDHGDGERA